MLSSIRKFSSSIYAKILLGIVVIPFVFWGMGSSLKGGSKNVVVVIDKEKYSVQEFVDFIQKYTSVPSSVDDKEIENLLSVFIGEKLIQKEITDFKIKLSDNSLGQLIKNQKEFKKDGKFSRTMYEKFLVQNNVTAANFEYRLSEQEKKKQLMEFIAGGVVPSEFLVNNSYDKINQKREIQLINLKKIFNEQLNFTNDEIKDYYEKNKVRFNETHITAKVLELTPEKITGTNEFNDIFFKRIDEIDDLIMEGENLNSIEQKFNLEKTKAIIVNKEGFDIDLKSKSIFSKNIIKRIFSISNDTKTVFAEDQDKYFVLEIVKTEIVEKNIKNESLRKRIISELGSETKGKFVNEIIKKINGNNFNKSDFNKFSSEKNISIQKIKIKNQNDTSLLKKEMLNEIYKAPIKKVILIHDLDLSQNYLIFIDNVTNVNIDKEAENYEKYFNLSKINITTNLFNAYDSYIKKKYKIDINYKALNIAKNYFK